MPEWKGGPCPDCGTEMPAGLVHCQNCRALLNEDLRALVTDREPPEFFPLEEINAMIEVLPAGVYVVCPHCEEELRIHRKYLGNDVACKRCDGSFLLDPARGNVRLKALFAVCPHCSEELRLAAKYVGSKVVCRFCGGHLHLVRRQPA